MKKITCYLFSLLFFGFVQAADNKHFDTMVVFGDSLSDNGNLYNYLWHTLPASPPYYLGHFSNGPLWAEQLYRSYFPEEYIEGFQNYAVGGAGAVFSYKQNLPYTLTLELDNYLYWHTYGKKDTTLYTIWIGGNNYLNGPTNKESITDSVVNAIGTVTERLIQDGGNKFFIPNMPDLARTPYVIEQGNQELLHELVVLHNKKLAAKIDELKARYPEVTLIPFDVYSYFNEALKQNQFGFSHVSEPCYYGGYIVWLTNQHPSDQQLQSYVNSLNPHIDATHWDLTNNPQLKEVVTASYLYQLLPAKNKEEPLLCDDYVFWDKIHPTTKAHAFLADQARRLLDEAGLYAVTALEDSPA